MNPDNQGNNSDASASVPARRKRGRPRKYPRPNLNHGENDHVPRDGVNACAPPGAEGANRNQPRQAEPIGEGNDIMMGQPVHGVIEAAFDAGYLLSVRVGPSETMLRGVVFKPGHYVPVSADNDVAPHVRMIRRNHVPFPAENFAQVQGSRSRDSRNGFAHLFGESQPANQMARVKARQVTSGPVETAKPVIPRGNVVPVVLKPVNLSNGGPAVNQPSQVGSQAHHLTTFKGKQVSDTNGSTPTNQVLTEESQVLPSQPASSHQTIPGGMQTEAGVFKQFLTEELPESEDKPRNLPGMPFEKLLTEVMKRIQSPSQSVETQTEDQALSIEPLQAVQMDHSVSMPKPLENYRTGKMTELLQAVQENMIETQASGAEAAEARISPNPETESEKEGSLFENKPLQAASV